MSSFTVPFGQLVAEACEQCPEAPDVLLDALFNSGIAQFGQVEPLQEPTAKKFTPVLVG